MKDSRLEELEETLRVTREGGGARRLVWDVRDKEHSER